MKNAESRQRELRIIIKVEKVLTQNILHWHEARNDGIPLINMEAIEII